MGVNRCEPMVHEPCEWIVPKERHEFESDPYHPIRDVAVCWFSPPRVFTRGYNMPSRWDSAQTTKQQKKAANER